LGGVSSLKEMKMEAPMTDKSSRPNTALLASLFVSVNSGLGFVWMASRDPSLFGLVLFFGAPFVVGFLASWIHCTISPASPITNVLLISQASILLMGVAIVSLAFDGLICLAMAYPLAALAGFLG